MHRAQSRAGVWRRFAAALGLILVAAGAVPPLCGVVSVGDLSVQQARPADDPGWDSVVTPSTASGVYLGNRWVLTAGHVGFPANIVGSTGVIASQPGSWIRLCSPDGAAETDLALFRLAADPGLPVAKTITRPLSLGTDIVLIGFGLQRGAAASYDANWVLGGTPVKYTGFQAAGWGRSWGRNRISGVVDADYGWGPCRVYAAAFDKPGTGDSTTAEAMIAACDSGGAIFAREDGQWRLAGTLVAFPDLPGQPYFTAIWGNDSWAMELSTYKTQIDAVLALADGYSIWQYQNLRGTASTAAADPDGDGFTNLEEYAFGLDPQEKNPRSVAPQIALAAYADGPALTASFNRSTLATDAVPTVEVSSDLATWTSAPGALAVISSADLGNDVQRLVVRDTATTGTAVRRFMRVRIVRAP